MFENDANYLIEKELWKLDNVAKDVEARWGVGRLPTLVSPELSEKWERQCDKLDEAVQNRDLRAVQRLVPASVRGYSLMEQEAAQRGNLELPVDVWEVETETGFKLRVVKNNNDAMRSHEKGVVTWTLAEVARVIEKDYTLVNKIKDTLGTELKSVRNKPKIDFEKGDEIPF